MSITRLAKHIFDTNRHLAQFEVELGDKQTSAEVSKELMLLGCTVEHDPFRPKLTVRCPADTTAVQR